ncbi:MAG: lipid-A-disaccharide synthase N-terminal domain-containing protein [Planctomycetota bacterium]|nr:lipid-A-disaccharide synthase N-terminal domain-containing protein [Planctomycetota bacterium]
MMDLPDLALTISLLGSMVADGWCDIRDLLALHDPQSGRDFFEEFWHKLSTDRWVLVGYGGQAIFFMRWIVQWWISEKAGKSEIPIAFWWISITGGCITFAYAIARIEPVLLLGQSLALVMYSRNLALVYREKSK